MAIIVAVWLSSLVGAIFSAGQASHDRCILTPKNELYLDTQKCNIGHAVILESLVMKPVRTPVAILGSLGVCNYVPASRHWLISYSPIHLT